MPSKSPSYSIRFSPEELESLRRRAEREDRAISDIIRDALAGSGRDAEVEVTAATAVPLRIAFFKGMPAAVLTTARDGKSARLDAELSEPVTA